ncbi:hypothetical protein RI367_004419 [Sorochytrium milnesiophthora]
MAKAPRSRTKRLVVAAIVLAVVITAAVVGGLAGAGKLKSSSDSSASSSSSSGNAPAGNGGTAAGGNSVPAVPPLGPLNTTGFLGRAVTPSDKGIIFGTHIWGQGVDWAPKDPQSVNAAMGMRMGAFGYYDRVDSVTGVTDKQALKDKAALAKAQGAFLFFTYEPISGLGNVTDQACSAIADLLAEINADGVPVVLRFAHEMDGGWYSWAHQPTLYIATWRRLATAVRAKANLTSLMWAPNSPNAYPWKVPTEATPEDIKVLDTNHDGVLDGQDDPFSPYWPGDDVVDWIGMSAFFRGPIQPDGVHYGHNTISDDNRAYTLMTGTTPDSHFSLADFASKHGKPLAFSETTIIYYPHSNFTATVNEAQMKQWWMAQLFSKEVFDLGVRMAMWFEFLKDEDENYADCALTHNPDVAAAVSNDVRTKKYRFLGADNILQ